jgi:FkbM family methyltransferase
MEVSRHRPFFTRLRSSVLKKRLDAYRIIQRARGRRETKIRCRYFDADFIGILDDFVSYAIAAKYFEWHEIKMMIEACRRIKPDIFFDVGANIGLYSCILGIHKLVPRIIAFEPDRQNFESLKVNLGLNGVAVNAYEIAVGAKAGTASLFPSGIENRGASQIFSTGNGAYQVKVAALDDLFDIKESVIAIKIDVEGYESEVLAGAKTLFGRNQGYAQIEASGDSATAVRKSMAALGWRECGCHGVDIRFERL